MQITESMCRELYGEPKNFNGFKLYTHNEMSLRKLLTASGTPFDAIMRQYNVKGNYSYAVQYVLPFNTVPDIVIAFCDDTKPYGLVYNVSNPIFTEGGLVTPDIVALTSTWSI